MRGRRVERLLGEQMARYNGQRGSRNREAMASPEGGWTGAATEGPPLPGEGYGASIRWRHRWWTEPAECWPRVDWLERWVVMGGRLAVPDSAESYRV
jgi:hypothetical protein